MEWSCECGVDLGFSQIGLVCARIVICITMVMMIELEIEGLHGSISAQIMCGSC